MSSKRLVIVGGGITGLAAAYFAERLFPDLNITVLEAGERLGGKVATYREDGFMIERGPDSYVARKHILTDLIEAVGLGDKLVRNNTSQAFILDPGGLHPIPKGSVMGIPTDLNLFSETTLLTDSEKAEVARLLLHPSDQLTIPEEDIPLGSYLRPRLGDALVEKLIEPLLSGIYAGNIDQMSTFATYPQFVANEQKAGSLFEGMRLMRPTAQVQGQTKPTTGQFLSLSTGLESLVERLEEVLERTEIRLETPLLEVARENERYRLKTDHGPEYADYVLLTIPHPQVVSLLPDADLRELEQLKTHSTATVTLIFDEQATLPIEGTGFVVNRRAPYSITACTAIDQKWSHSAPNHTVLRAFVGRPGNDALVHETDDVIKETVLKDLEQICGQTLAPRQVIISRLVDGLPAYTVGHAGRIQIVRDEVMSKYPGVYLAGLAYDGVGLPDCVASAKTMVEEIAIQHGHEQSNA
ncbi:MAG: protoporphyrinogen oxidase [Exiguobacterium oxidotolerans]